MATKKLTVVYDDKDVLPENQTPFTKGIVCSGCDLESKSRITGQGDSSADIMFISESPSWASACNKKIFYGRGGQIIKTTVKQLIDADNKLQTPFGFAKLKKYETYAIQCEADKEGISKATLDRCSLYLHSAITTRKPKILLTFGSNALKAVGIKAQKFNEVRGKLLTTTIGKDTYNVLPTFSTKALLAKPGLFNLFKADVLRALKLATETDLLASQIPIEDITKNYKIPRTIEEVKAICKEILEYAGTGGDPAAWTIAVDTETNTLYPHKQDARLLCVSFAWDTGKATAIPLWHKDCSWPAEEALPFIAEVLASAKPKVFHNAKFDLKFLELTTKLTVNNVRWCTLVGEHYLNENQSGSYSLKTLGRSFFPEFSNYADKIHDLAEAESKKAAKSTLTVSRNKRKSLAKGMEELPIFEISAKDALEALGFAEKKKKLVTDGGYENVPLDELLLYAAIDTDLTRRLLRHQIKRISDEGSSKIRQMMQNLSIPASRVLGKMEYSGFRVDRDYVQDLIDNKLTKVINETDVELRKHWDGGPSGTKEFKINSPADIGYLLYNKGVVIDLNGDINNPNNRKTYLIPSIVEMNEKSQQWKTNKKTLKALAEKAECNFAKAVLDYRAAFKARNTFLAETLVLSELDGKIHTNFNLQGTATGRLSSNSINLQNIPSGLADCNIKKMFIPDDPENELIVNIDYKGAEVRIFAAFSKDQKLIDALNAGLDPHSFFASKVYNEPYEDIQAVQADTFKGDPLRAKKLKQARKITKGVVFGILYGAGPKKIAETAGISKEDAIQVINLMFSMFPSLQEYVASTKAFIDRNLYVETHDGRRRRFPLVHTSSFFRSEAHRQGVNMRIQGQSSDIVLGQLIELDEHIHEVGGRLIITVHDSIVASVNKKFVTKLPEFLNYYCVQRVTEKYPWLPVQFKCDIEIGPSYGELIPLEAYLKNNASILHISPETLRERTWEEELISGLSTDKEINPDDSDEE